MKYLFSFAVMLGLFMLANTVNAQETTKPRPSPPAAVAKKLASGAEVSISYSQPSVKGRTIGKDLEPKDGKVWRTGANEATVFETTKDITVDGKKLPAGKYSLFTIADKDEWTVIFNKTWKQWGAYDYKQADDALRLDVKAQKAPSFAEKMTFDISDKGLVSLVWGDHKIAFTVK